MNDNESPVEIIMNGTLRSLLLVGLILAPGGMLRAEVAVPAIFSKNMVLQAETPVAVFGTAADGEQVTVEFAGQKKTAQPQAGKWRVLLDPLPPGTSGTLKVAGRNTISVENVLVGEVWHVSGQSNMKFPLATATGGAEEAAQANFPQIRYFEPPKGPWRVCSPQKSLHFSAVAYFFAVELHRHLSRPVAIIDSAINGAVGQQFISTQAIEKDAELQRMLKSQEVKGGGIFARSISAVVPYGIRGVLWCPGGNHRPRPGRPRALPE
jgi:sialate O-acetylesterase